MTAGAIQLLVDDSMASALDCLYVCSQLEGWQVGSPSPQVWPSVLQCLERGRQQGGQRASCSSGASRALYRIAREGRENLEMN